MILSVSATYSVRSINWMPNGECRCSSKTCASHSPGSGLLAQQRDPVSALFALAGTILDEPGEELLGCRDRFGARAVRLDDEHIAVGQRQQLTRMQQAAGDFLDAQAAGNNGMRVALPADSGGHLHRRHEEALRLRQLRIVAHLRPGDRAGRDRRMRSGRPRTPPRSAVVLFFLFMIGPSLSPAAGSAATFASTSRTTVRHESHRPSGITPYASRL